MVPDVRCVSVLILARFDGPILANWLCISGVHGVPLLHGLDSKSWLGAATVAAARYPGQLLAWESIDTLTEMARPYIKAQGATRGAGLQAMMSRFGIKVYGGQGGVLKAHR
jgi:hypothetical protein